MGGKPALSPNFCRVRRDFWREYVWVSRHVSVDEYASLPIREKAALQIEARRHREATAPQWPFGGGGDDD